MKKENQKQNVEFHTVDGSKWNKGKEEQMDSLIEKMMAVSGIFKWEHFPRKKTNRIDIERK